MKSGSLRLMPTLPNTTTLCGASFLSTMTMRVFASGAGVGTLSAATVPVDHLASALSSFALASVSVISPTTTTAALFDR